MIPITKPNPIQVYKWLFAVCFLTSQYPATSAQEAQKPNGPRLILSLPTTTLKLGQTIKLTLKVTNESKSNVILIRPVEGSWENRREPRYSLVFTDKEGHVIPDPLGAQSGSWCGNMNSITPRDFVRVASGAAAALTTGSSYPLSDKVQPSARPGHYWMRVRYEAKKLPGATPLIIESNKIEVEITGGSEKLWQQFQSNVFRSRNYSYASVRPCSAFRINNRFVVVFSRYVNVTLNSVDQSYGELYAQLMDERGRVTGKPTLLISTPREMGLAVTAQVPDGFVVAYTPGAVGGRAVDIMHVRLTGDAILPDAPWRLSNPPGNPFFLGMSKVGEQIGLAYESNDGNGEKIAFVLLDSTGKQKTQPIYTHAAREFALAGKDTGWCLAIADRDGKLELIDIESQGRPSGNFVRPQTPADLSIDTMWSDNNGITLSMRYSGGGLVNAFPGMGMFLVHCPWNGKPTPPRPISPLSHTDLHFGTATETISPEGNRRTALIYGDGKRLVFRSIDASGTGPATTVSQSAGGSWKLSGDKLGVVAIWSDAHDYRTGDSKNPTDTVEEVYFATFDLNGRPQIQPTRVTQLAQLRRTIYSSKDLEIKAR